MLISCKPLPLPDPVPIFTKCLIKKGKFQVLIGWNNEDWSKEMEGYNRPNERKKMQKQITIQIDNKGRGKKNPLNLRL